jgi:tRNA-splicing ligase RtcB (3'-phosphate/5'-hydroxy nucleic acid ligase)
MKIISTEKLPVKMWLDEVEEGAMNQIRNLANLPFAFKHIAVMPDAHPGFGMPIGGVLAAKGMIIPNAVGVDIGCGICAVKTSLTDINKDSLKKLIGEIKRTIPLGFEHYKQKQDVSLMPDEKSLMSGQKPVIEKEYNSALTQIGTLGGGNHFIEFQKGPAGNIWVMIHSGSRNLGKQVADYYNKLAIRLNEKWNSPVPRKWELAYLPIDSEEGQAYIREMNYCVEFALANRKLIMSKIIELFSDETNAVGMNFINIAHNYAKMENHFRENVMVHRKGATLAASGTIGIIPGSQGAPSYIVKGKGNPDSFNSCSHGAGRRMGRRQAVRELNLEDEINKLNSLGIVHAVKGKKDLDEASGAYKDIRSVMKNQEDLVEILVELIPLGVIKG